MGPANNVTDSVSLKNISVYMILL